MTFEDRLRRELQHAGAALPVGRVRLEDTVARGRSLRRRATVVRLGAAAGVAATVAAGVALILGTDRPGPAPRPPVATGDPGPPPATATPGPRLTGPALGRIEPVARQWLSAISSGDEDAAWALMTPEARAEVGRARFDEMMLSALPEGLGAFARAGEMSHVVVSVAGERADAVAVVRGEVTREGTTEYAATALPVRVEGREVLIDAHFMEGARYRDRIAVFASESAGPFSFHQGDELVVEFADPRGIRDVEIALDGQSRPLPTDYDPATGTATATLESDLEPGHHVATVIVVGPSERLYPEAIVFRAAAP